MSYLQKIFFLIISSLGLLFQATATDRMKESPSTSPTPQQARAPQSSDSTSQTEREAEKIGVPADQIYVITHYQVATENKCWATFYNDEGFKGQSVTLSGKQNLEDIKFDLDPGTIGGSPDSVIIGPGATLELYGDENFKNLDHKFTANTSVADLKHKPFWDSIESVRLKCDDSQVDKAYSE